MAREIRLMLAGKEYMVRQLPTRPNVAWQRQVAVHLQSILKAVPDLVDQIKPLFETKDVPTPKTASARELLADGKLTDQLSSLATLGADLIVEVVDAQLIILDLVTSYGPMLTAAKKEIENEAPADEIIDAFVALVKLSFPFGERVAGWLSTMTPPGSPKTATLPSSPDPSGEPGTTSSTTT